ncbi:MAG: hypothetical protein AAFV80_12345 [Bacteroidota bacterium]
MRILGFFALILILSVFSACSKDEVEQIQSTPSSCLNSSGVEGLYWDISNGIPRGDIPGGVPTIKNPGGTFFHPSQPILGFQYPAGWTPQTLSDPVNATIGVNLFRNDNQAIYRFVSLTVPGILTVDDVFNFEKSSMEATFGLGTTTEICSNGGSDNSFGVFISGRSALVEGNGFKSILNVNVTHVPGLNSSFINVQVTAAPSDQYETEVLDTFLPIGWQMLYRPSGDTFLSDRDGDGVIDIDDADPDDPNVQ